MAKFYVNSGDLKCVLDAESPETAVMEALNHVQIGDELSLLTKASEIGFDSVNDDDLLFLTADILTKAGITNDFSNLSDAAPDDESNLAQE